MMEQRDELPIRWKKITLSEIGKWGSGGTPARNNPNYYDGDIPWLIIGDLNDGLVSEAKSSITEIGLENSSAKVLPPGTLLVAMYGSIGKLGISGFSCATNQAIAFCQVNERITITNYVFYYLLMSRAELLELGQGGTQRNISQTILKAFPIPIPPLNEQRRIVAKIEQLFTSLDKAEQALRDTQKLLATYRQAILKAAVTGELTADWRAQREGNLPSGANLVERLNKERSAYYDHEIKLWNDSVSIWERSGGQGKKPSKPRKPANVFSDDDLTFSMPDNWTLLPLGAIVAEAVLGKMLDKNKNKGSPRTYLGNINVRWGSFDMELQKTMLFEDYEIDRYSLRAGDLVVCEGGEPGRCAIWNGEDNQVFVQKALHRIRFTHSYLPSFAYYYLKFATEAGLLDKHYTGTTIKHLTGRELEQVVFPVCSLAEQQEIVQRVESSIFNARTAELCIERELQRSAALRQSILKDAFSGQLVEQDPSDEPASALLARIARERAASQPKKTTRRPVKL